MGTKSTKLSNRFVVDLGELALSDDDRQRIASGIHGAVLSYLATNSKLPRSNVTLLPIEGVKGMLIDPDDDKGGKPGSKR